MAMEFVNDFVPGTNEVTVTTKLLLALDWPSLTFTLIVALPVCPFAGVTVTVRLEPLPPKVMLLTGTRLGSDELPFKFRLVAGLSASLTVKPNGPVVPFGLIVWFGMLEMDGGSLTALTVRTNVSLAVREPSLTVTVRVAVPFWLAAGLTVRVRLAPEPPNTMFPFGTSVGFEDDPVSERSPGGVSRSPTEKAIGPAGVSSLVVWSARFVIVGAVFVPVILYRCSTQSSPSIGEARFCPFAVVVAVRLSSVFLALNHSTWYGPFVTVTLTLPLESR